MDSASMRSRWSEVLALYASNPTIQTRTAQAVLGGLYADRLAWAFLAGYQQALRALCPQIDTQTLAAFCVTESGGNSPSAIQARLQADGDDFLLSGEKTFVTGAAEADLLLVAATTGIDDQDRSVIKMVELQARQAGITITAGRDLGVVPELPHGAARFDNVRVQASHILTGDGYTNYIKRFRTLEDIHVQSATCGYLLSIARRFDWPDDVIEPLIAIIAMYCSLEDADPDSAGTHIQLAAIEAFWAQWLDRSSAYWDLVTDDERSRWQRDSKLMQVASKTRSIRRQRAWERIARSRS